MSLSKTLYQLQELDSSLDSSSKRISQIDQTLNDHQDLESALKVQDIAGEQLNEKQKLLKQAEQLVEDQNTKIAQNQKRLYSGGISNPKELEDLQLESISLQRYLKVLEERQLEAMLVAEQAQFEFDQASVRVGELSDIKTARDATLFQEKEELEKLLLRTQKEKQNFLEKNDIPDLADYQRLRKSLNGIAVTLMISNGCSSCGSNIPSAIAQEVRSPKKITNCPTCKRILHPS
jgi:predicted  nucleic acid-binding Zn-ribbon protein